MLQQPGAALHRRGTVGHGRDRQQTALPQDASAPVVGEGDAAVGPVELGGRYRTARAGLGISLGLQAKIGIEQALRRLDEIHDIDAQVRLVVSVLEPPACRGAPAHSEHEASDANRPIGLVDQAGRLRQHHLHRSVPRRRAWRRLRGRRGSGGRLRRRLGRRGRCDGLVGGRTGSRWRGGRSRDVAGLWRSRLPRGGHGLLRSRLGRRRSSAGRAGSARRTRADRRQRRGLDARGPAASGREGPHHGAASGQCDWSLRRRQQRNVDHRGRWLAPRQQYPDARQRLPCRQVNQDGQHERDTGPRRQARTAVRQGHRGHDRENKIPGSPTVDPNAGGSIQWPIRIPWLECRLRNRSRTT